MDNNRHGQLHMHSSKSKSKNIQQHYANKAYGRETEAQAGLCAIVLSSFRSVSNLSKNFDLSSTTWDTLLITMLRIGDVLLSGPSERGDLTDIATGELYMDTLLNVWLRACVKNFPTPPFWKTLTEYMQSWRHHSLVVEKWTLTASYLTSRLVDQMHGPGYSQLQGIKEEEISAVIHNLSGNVLIQTCYRFFHLIGNPVEIIEKEYFIKNPKFIKAMRNLEFHQIWIIRQGIRISECLQSSRFGFYAKTKTFVESSKI